MILSKPISASGEAVPVIGLGTWQTFDAGPAEQSRAPLRSVLQELARAGATVVDSSPMYGRSESVVGDLVAELGIRSRLFIATKVWTTGRAEGIEQMEESMRKLRARLMFMHDALWQNLSRGLKLAGLPD